MHLDDLTNKVSLPNIEITKLLYGKNDRKISTRSDLNFDDIALIVPIFNRPLHFKMFIEHLTNMCEKIEVIIVDQSNKKNAKLHEKIIEDAVDRRPQIDFKFFHVSGLPSIDQITYGLERTSKTYVYRIPDDDFIVFSSLPIALEILKKGDGVVGVSGKQLRIEHHPNGDLVVSKGLTHSVTDENVDKRLLYSIITSNNILSNIIKRDTLLSALQLIRPVVPSLNDHLWDRFLSLYTVVEGKIEYMNYFQQVIDANSVMHPSRFNIHYWYESLIFQKGDPCGVNLLFDNLKKIYFKHHKIEIKGELLRSILVYLLSGTLNNINDHLASLGRRAAVHESIVGPIFFDSDKPMVAEINSILSIAFRRWQALQIKSDL